MVRSAEKQRAYRKAWAATERGRASARASHRKHEAKRLAAERRAHVPTVAERFFAKVNMTEGCWLWTGGTANEYGQFVTRKPERKQAHVFCFEGVRGPVPDGLEIDHLCRNKLCVRPDHLEAVTHAVNVARAWPYRADPSFMARDSEGRFA